MGHELDIFDNQFSLICTTKKVGCYESKSLHSGDFKTNEAKKEA